jgi:hypothetical protein
VAASDLAALDHHERACEETPGIVLAGVSSGAGLDALEHQQGVDDRRAERSPATYRFVTEASDARRSRLGPPCGTAGMLSTL